MSLVFRYIFLLVILTGISHRVFLQDISFPSKIIEYHPAPGQYINVPGTGTPEAAANLSGKIGSPVSLGGYGGYIIFGFDKAIKNHPENPYGIDFIIVGNAIEGNSEQGIVQVMKDENKNGLADDTWYEIKGSDHFLKRFKKNYRIKYLNQGADADVPWFDNNFSSGFIKRNDFHSQAYYPMADYFPFLNKDSLIFEASLLPGKVMEVDGKIISERSLFGYADNTVFRSLSSPLIPDNPYTPEVEGCGGDGIDISWAVDENDNYVELDEIDFIKIYTGINQNKGVLGEISTEISGIIVVSPVQGLTGNNKMIMPLNIPASISEGSRIRPEAIVFSKGKAVENEKVIWKSANTDIASISNDTINFIRKGTTVLRAFLENDTTVFSEHVLRVFHISEIWVPEKYIALREGDIKKLSYKVFDDSLKLVKGVELKVNIENREIVNAGCLTENNEIIIEGIKEGYSTIEIYSEGFPEIRQSIIVNVYNPLPEISCSFSLKNGDRPVISHYKPRVSGFDYSDFIDRKPADFKLQTDFISIASVIAYSLNEYGYNKAGNTFKFRMDDKSKGELYLWQLVENWEYIYGWGGSREGEINKSCWTATLNGRLYLNAFDKIPLKEGDHLSINYVPDIGSGFREVIIEDLNQYEADGISRKFRLSAYDHYIDVNGDILSSKIVLSDEKVLLRKDNEISDLNIITDKNGEFAISFESSGIYYIWAENYPEEELLFIETESAENSSEDINFRIYPNPFSNKLFILNSEMTEMEFQCIDISGKCLIEGKLNNGENIIEEFAGFQPGIYMLKIFSAQKIYFIKIIKNN